jgi:type VI protein secretion system component VasK
VPVRIRWIIAGGLAAIGLVWIGQGLGLLQGSSFMVGDPRWAIAGGLFVVGGAALGWRALRGRSGA